MKKIIYMFILVFLVFVSGCSQETGNESADPEESITIEHELGETVVHKHPENLVVFDFGILDILDVLEIEVAGIPRGNIPTYLDHYDTEAYENVGSLKEPDFDKIAEINPELIIISGRQATLYDELSNIAPTIYLDIDIENYMESFEYHLTIIGEIFDREEIADAFAKIEKSIDELQKITAEHDEKSLIILANDDKVSAYGPKSRFGLIHDVFGVDPVDDGIEASTHGQNISFEYILDKDPDLVYVIDRSAVVGGESSAEQIVENKIMEQTKAYQNDRIIYLDPNYWYLSSGGLISLQYMIDEIKESLK